MTDFLEIPLAGECMVLLAERALFWPAAETLIVADAHLGKAAHFRKSGLALPQQAFLADLQRLQELVKRWQPARIMYLGDLFHSAPNREWDDFAAWLTATPIQHLLVKGNHDSQLKNHAISIQMQVVDVWREGSFVFTHEPLESVDEDAYNLCGHIHPGVLFRGKAGSALRLPCFWFAEKTGILPAFGNLTGAARLKGKATVFAIGNQQIFSL